jgi:hypothetical protein
VVHYILVVLEAGKMAEPVEVDKMVEPVEEEEVDRLNYTEVVVLYNHTGSLFV